jgi:hypothetical protein
VGKPLVILDPKEERCDEVIEDLVATPHESIEDYACPLFPKEAHHHAEVHLHEDKGMVSHIPFQISEFSDESFDDLERGGGVVEKPLEHGIQEDEDISSLFLIGSHRWDVYHWFLHE